MSIAFYGITTLSLTVLALAHDVAPVLRDICSTDSEVMPNGRVRLSGHAII